MGHGTVKNWRWLWGTTTWLDRVGYLGIKAADIAHMGTFGGISEVALKQVLGIVRVTIDGVRGKQEALKGPEQLPALNDREQLPAISDLYQAAVQALDSSGDEAGSRRRYREFQKEFDKLDPGVRDAYLLRVFEKGMRRKAKSKPLSIEDRSRSAPRQGRPRAIRDASSSSTAVMPYGMNNVRLPNARYPYSDTEQSESAGPSRAPSALSKIQVQRRRRMHRDDAPQSSSGGQQAPLVNYAPGVRPSKRGGAKIIQGLAPVLEFNEAADDPYVMRQQVR